MTLKAHCKVFYADDDEDDRYLFASALQSIDSSIKLETFENGLTLEEALIEENAGCDVIFLDLNMPVQNGIDTLQALQEEIRHRSLKIVIFSTSSDPSVVKKAFDLNAVLYVRKPDDFYELVETLRKIIGIACNLQEPSSFAEFKYNFS